MPLHIVHHPAYDAQFDAGHRFPMSKYSLLMREIEARGLAAEGYVHAPKLASRALLALAHQRTYVDQVCDLAVPQAIEKEIGFAVDDKVSRRARYASTDTLLAARLALEHGLACNTAGGSHHARRAHGAGFCTFNDVGVAACALLAASEVERILIVDLDVHQGDGTADIFALEPRVFTFSMHAERNYPARKIPSSLDVGLPDGLDDHAYLDRLNAALPQLLEQGRPDLVFYNAGVDPHADDRLGRMKLSDRGLEWRERTVIDFFRSRHIPLCGVIGGGYSYDAAAVASRHAILFQVASQFSGD